MSNNPTTTEKPTGVAKQPTDVKGLMGLSSVKKRFEDIMGDKAPAFISSVLNVVNGNTQLGQCSPDSVIMSAAVAATLDLPINPNLGFAYIIPYGKSYKDHEDKWQKKYVAQFQMGYKGFIQLAMRTGQYDKLNVIPIYAGQLKSVNPLTEDYVFDFTIDTEGKEVVGFCAYFRLTNGFNKTVYWNVAKVNAHAKRFSKAYNDKSSPWHTDYAEMAMKTVLKHTLSKYGILSVEMQKAFNTDQAVIKEVTDNGDIATDFIDATIVEPVQIEEPKQTIENNNEFVNQGPVDTLPNSNDL